MNFLKRTGLCFAALVLGLAGAANGQTSTAPSFWTGLSTNGNQAWNDPLNWQGQVLPPNNGSAYIFFQNVAGSTSVYLPVSESVNGVFFNGSFSYYNLFGNVAETGPNSYTSTALTLGSGGLSFFPSDGSTNSQLSLPVVVGADQTWTVGNGTLQLQGSYNGGTNLPGTGGLRGSGNVTLAGMNGGRLEIDTASPGYSGNFTVMAGATLRLGDNGALV